MLSHFKVPSICRVISVRLPPVIPPATWKVELGTRRVSPGCKTARALFITRVLNWHVAKAASLGFAPRSTMFTMLEANATEAPKASKMPLINADGMRLVNATLAPVESQYNHCSKPACGALQQAASATSTLATQITQTSTREILIERPFIIPASVIVCLPQRVLRRWQMGHAHWIGPPSLNPFRRQTPPVEIAAPQVVRT